MYKMMVQLQVHWKLPHTCTRWWYNYRYIICTLPKRCTRWWYNYRYIVHYPIDVQDESTITGPHTYIYKIMVQLQVYCTLPHICIRWCYNYPIHMYIYKIMVQLQVPIHTYIRSWYNYRCIVHYPIYVKDDGTITGILYTTPYMYKTMVQLQVYCTLPHICILWW